MWREGGRESRAHSPELVVARLLVIAHVLVITPVLTITRVLVVARVRSWALAVIHEPRWLFWLVVGRVRRDSWAMVKGARRWVVVAACGQWMVAGDRSWAVHRRVVVLSCLVPWTWTPRRGVVIASTWVMCKKGERRGVDVAHLDHVHHSSNIVVGCPVANGDVAPTSREYKGERGKA